MALQLSTKRQYSKSRLAGLLFAIFALAAQPFLAMNLPTVFAAEIAALAPVLWNGSNYKGINVDMRFKDVTGLEGAVVTVNRADGSTVVKTMKQSRIDWVNAQNGQLTTLTIPFVIQALTYNEADSGSWSLPSTTSWTKASVPRSVTLGFEFSDTSKNFSRTEEVATNGISYDSLVPVPITPSITGLAPVLWDGGNYKGINVDTTFKDVQGLTGVTVTINRADGSTVVKTMKQSRIDWANSQNGAASSLTTPFVIQAGTYDETASSSWSLPSTTSWTKASVPQSVTMVFTFDDASKNITKTADIDSRGIVYASLLPIDRTAPATTIIAPTGVVGNTFVVTGTATDNENLNRVYVQLVNRDNGQRYGGTTVNLIGKGTKAEWSVVYDAKQWSLSSGRYAAHVSVVDMNGNTGSAGWTENFTVDITAPETTLKTPTGLVGGSFTVSGTATDNQSLNRVYVQLVNRENSQRYGGTTVHLIGQGTSADWSVQYTAATHGLPDGIYAAHVAVVDMVGNVANVGWSENFTIDATTPTVAFTSPVNNSAHRGAVEIKATVQDEHLRHYYYKVDRKTATGTWQHVASATVLSGSITNKTIYTLPATALEGDYRVQLAARDAVGGTADSGNRSQDVYLYFRVDKTAPTVQLDVAATNPTQATVTVADDYKLGNAYVDLYRNKVVNGANQVDWTTKQSLCGGSFAGMSEGTKTCTLPELTDGIYWLRVGGFDLVGNGATAFNRMFIVDTTLPQEAGPSTVVNTGGAGTGTGSPAFVSTAGLQSVRGSYVYRSSGVQVGDLGEASAEIVATPTTPAVLSATDTAMLPTQASDQNIFGATDETSECGKILGLCWYWWVPIGIATAGVIWFAAAYVRRRSADAAAWL